MLNYQRVLNSQFLDAPGPDSKGQLLQRVGELHHIQALIEVKAKHQVQEIWGQVHLQTTGPVGFNAITALALLGSDKIPDMPYIYTYMCMYIYIHNNIYYVDYIITRKIQI